MNPENAIRTGKRFVLSLARVLGGLSCIAVASILAGCEPVVVEVPVQVQVPNCRLPEYQRAQILPRRSLGRARPAVQCRRAVGRSGACQYARLREHVSREHVLQSDPAAAQRAGGAGPDCRFPEAKQQDDHL